MTMKNILTDINDKESLNFVKIILAVALSFYENVVFDSTTNYSDIKGRIIKGRIVKCNSPIFIHSRYYW